MQSYKKLKEIYKRFSHLNYLQRLLLWDEAVMMPEGAGVARAEAIATLNRAIQAILLAKKTKNLLIETRLPENASHWDVANLTWMNTLQKRASVIPLSLVEKSTKAQLACHQAWRNMREKNDWAGFLPFLEDSFRYVIEIAKRRSEVLGVDPYDALLDEYAPGFNQKTINPLFETLKQTLPKLIQQIQDKQAKHQSIKLLGPFLPENQKKLGLAVMKDLGFDFNHGRLDVSHHPFCSGGPKDVRMTTRYSEDEFLSSLLAICHETGHALYEQGLPDAWLDQPVGAVHSMAMHESQSLLIEMEVCHAQSFYKYLLPKITAQFGEQEGFTSDNLYRVASVVKPGFIRVDADEVSYPLHVIIRYEVEKQLLNESISIKDLPEIWDALMQKYLGLSTKGNDRQGVMQDVHWAVGAFGYFPAYTLGRLIAAQLFACFYAELPNFEDDIQVGNFNPLIQWLDKNVYSQASSLSTDALLQHVTGQGLDAKFFLEGLKKRYL